MSNDQQSAVSQLLALGFWTSYEERRNERLGALLLRKHFGILTLVIYQLQWTKPPEGDPAAAHAARAPGPPLPLGGGSSLWQQKK